MELGESNDFKMGMEMGESNDFKNRMEMSKSNDLKTRMKPIKRYKKDAATDIRMITYIIDR